MKMGNSLGIGKMALLVFLLTAWKSGISMVFSIEKTGHPSFGVMDQNIGISTDLAIGWVVLPSPIVMAQNIGVSMAFVTDWAALLSFILVGQNIGMSEVSFIEKTDLP